MTTHIKSPRCARARRAIMLAALAATASAPALAASIPLRWDPVPGARYKLYFGTAPKKYDAVLDLGWSGAYKLGGLEECRRYYIAVKSHDGAGRESAGYSSELSGLPTPVVSSISPATGETGAFMALTVSGSNFDVDASVDFGDPAITVVQTLYVSCKELQLFVQIAPDALAGASVVRVINPDRSYGATPPVFRIERKAGTSIPQVVETEPRDGATSVSIAVHPTVTFSTRMDPASITASRVRLLRDDGTAIPHAPGSPSLDSTGTVVTIVPYRDRPYSALCRIQVIGGSGGVRSLAGDPMDATFTQVQGFTTEKNPSARPLSVVSTTPPDGAEGVEPGAHLADGGALDPPSADMVAVTFSDEVDPLTVTTGSVLLLDSSGSPVDQAEGSPSLDEERLTAVITPAAPLAEGETYRIQVIGGQAGVRDLSDRFLEETLTYIQGFTTSSAAHRKKMSLRRWDRR